MEVESVLVTGANRGIGYEFVKQLSRLPKPPRYIFATYRNAETLQELRTLQETSEVSRIILIKMDVTNPEEVEIAKQVVEANVRDQGLNLLINNAGVAQAAPFPQLTAENLDLHFKANTVGPILVFQAMLPMLEKAAAARPGGFSVSRAAVLNLTSLAGSIANAGVHFTLDLVAVGYKISKAALNMAMRVIAANVKEKQILVVNMCPGWVKTDMGGKEMGEITPEQSISDMLQTLPKLDESHHGTYMNRMAEPYPF